MSTTYDAIIIGGGHNGLVAAAMLARAGLQVLVLERRQTLGGAAATEELFPGYQCNTGADDAGLFRPELVKVLELEKHGLTFVESPVSLFAPQADGTALTLWRDEKRTQAELARVCPADAARLPAFIALVKQLTGVLRQVMTLTPPVLTHLDLPALMPWMQSALKLRRAGDRQMMEFLRLLPMSAKGFLDEWFQSEGLKGSLGLDGVRGNLIAPQAAGTAFLFLYHHMEAATTGLAPIRFIRGGTGQLAAALARAAEEHGAEIRTGVEVSRILLQEGRATGIALASGDEINGRLVLANSDPRRTFFQLVDPAILEPRFMRRVRNMRYRGCTAKLVLALSGLPRFIGQAPGPEQLGGRIRLSPSLEYLERAYDDAKYGRFSARPALEITIPSVLDSSLAPSGHHVMSITMHYAPYHLQAGTWENQGEPLASATLDTLDPFAPNLRELIRYQHLITPLDWEQEYGMTEGSINHGQMGLDQLLHMRPVAGYAQYRTPFERLYLCGAGTHPGGGVTGLPGYNAARQVLRDWRNIR